MATITHLPAFCIAQEKFDFYTSNTGNDSFPGTSILLPKKTIAAIAPTLKKFSAENGIVKLGLKGGDVFEESLVTSYPIEINAYADNSAANTFAVLNGTKEFSKGWIKKEGTQNTFYQPIPYKGFVGYGINAIGQYSFISVFEIDKELEKSAPFTARRLLQFVANKTSVENTPGSFYTPITNNNPVDVYIHTSDGNSPNENKKYRYEVTVRDWGINSTYQPNNHFENLWVRGFGAGNGMLPGGDNSLYNKIIFGPGAGIHHLVTRSGTIDHSVFLPGARNTSSFAVVFYDAEGLGRHCTIKNSIFVDIPTPVYAHTSYGANYGAVELDKVVSFNDTVSNESFMYTANTDSVLLNDVYADGYRAGYFYGNAKYTAITNSCFKNVAFGIAYNDAFNSINSIVDNVFIQTKGTAAASGILMAAAMTLQLKNSIIHIKNTNTAVNATTGYFVAGAGGTKNKIVATGNIFVCDVNSNASLSAATTNTGDGLATSKDSWDNNVYILLNGKNIYWTVTNRATNGGSLTINNFEDWKKQSGQDKHSLFFDLRNDPRGLKAIFENPENGNYNLADTKEANQVAALHSGMTDAISCFLKRPTYEEAAELIRTNNTLSVKACRDPCTQNSIKVNTGFALDSLGSLQVKLRWVVSEQHNIDQYVIQRATGNSNFKIIGSVNVTPDSMYSFTDNVQSGVEYKYRLGVSAKSGSKCFSEIRSIKYQDNTPFSIYPNPSKGKIFVSMNGYIGPATFTVSNSMGKIVLVKEGASLYSSVELDISRQVAGIYWVKVKTLKGTSIQSFIVL